MGEYVSDVIRVGGDAASLTDVGGVLSGQVPVVLRVQKMKEVGRRSLDHHLRRVGLSGIHWVDKLVLGAVRHLTVPKGDERLAKNAISKKLTARYWGADKADPGLCGTNPSSSFEGSHRHSLNCRYDEVSFYNSALRCYWERFGT